MTSVEATMGDCLVVSSWKKLVADYESSPLPPPKWRTRMQSVQRVVPEHHEPLCFR